MMDHIYFNILVLVSLSIWHINGQESALNITKTTSTTSIKPILTSYPYQTLGFNSSDVMSGPILLIDKKTIFISNLNYNGYHRGAHFWAGTGIPSSNGILVPDENNLTGTLNAYHGRNIYLQLPGNLTTDKIDYLSIWSIEQKSEVSHVMLYSKGSDEIRKNIPEPSGFHQKTEDDKTIFRVPKCCGLNEFYIRDSGCQPSNTDVRVEYSVYKSNETHIDPDQFIDNIEFIPYVYRLKCLGEDFYRIKLEKPDVTFGLLFNSSLIYCDEFDRGVLSHGQFCMESMSGQETIILICAKETVIAAMPNMYFPLLVISTLCFFMSALCYLFILKAKDVHKKCFIGYSLSMTITFLSLIFLQKLNTACNFIGSLFIFSSICSFAWLTCLCIDLIVIVKSYKRFSDNTRLYYYVGFSLFIPVICSFASLVPDGIPDVPQSFVKQYTRAEMCPFIDSTIAIFFIPIGILILTSLIALVYTSYIINTHNDTTDFDWVRNKSDFKFMLRSCLLIWITTCIWLVEALVNVLSMSYGLQFAIDLIEASQGIFVVFIFVLNKYTRREILRVLKKDKHKREREMQYNALLQRLHQTRDADGAR